MPSAGPNSPTTAVSDASIGTIAWSNPTRCVSSNNSYARGIGLAAPTATTQYLKATGFGFAIPAGVTIQGIVAEIERRSNFNAEGFVVNDASIKLVKGGAIQGTDKAATLVNWPDADAYDTVYGGAADLWGSAWTADDINSADFGLAVAAELVDGLGIGQEAFVDHIRLTVHYAEAVPPASARRHDRRRLRAG